MWGGFGCRAAFAGLGTRQNRAELDPKCFARRPSTRSWILNAGVGESVTFRYRFFDVAEKNVRDIVSKKKRSLMMAAVRQRNTSPELNLRRALHGSGLRYALHRRDLPGTPDVVLVRYRMAIFVNGCFWHRHRGCPKATTPAIRAAFWRNKFAANVDRDRRAQRLLRAEGWKVFVVWECQVKNPELASRQAKRFLRSIRSLARSSAP